MSRTLESYISGLPEEDDFPRRLAVMGCTGSIGVNALKVAADNPGLFEIAGLAGAINLRLLAQQASAFRPPVLAVLTTQGARELRGLLPADYRPEILAGEQGYVDMASMPETDLVLAAQVGAAGLPPAYAAARAGKTIALANKEALVMAGGLFRKACAGSGARILPVDSEHNALFQAMIGHGDLDLESLVLTASGGPFRGKTAEELRQVTPEQALDHPNWSMGAKVSVDSATLMNKGLEVIEAYHLFGVPAERIEVVVHPQSIVHSLARYRDGSLIAQLGPPDMRIPIAYALAFPRRLDLPLQRLDLVTLGGLTFEKPALDIFPSLGLAYEALERGGSHPAALNAANEAAVSEFIAGRIAFADIARLIETALERVEDLGDTELEALLEVDRRVKDSVIGMACGRS